MIYIIGTWENNKDELFTRESWTVRILQSTNDYAFKKIDTDKNGKIKFGASVQELNQPKKTNTQDLRTIDFIYFTVKLNKQGGHVVTWYRF